MSAISRSNILSKAVRRHLVASRPTAFSQTRKIHDWPEVNDKNVPKSPSIERDYAEKSKLSTTLAEHTTKPLTVAERDAAMMSAWKDREGSLANAEFEGGQIEEGYRKNVVRYIPRVLKGKASS